SALLGSRLSAEHNRHSLARSASSLLLDEVPLDLLSEAPLMTFWIFRDKATVAVERIYGFLNDCCSCLPGVLATHVDIVNVDVEALRCLAEPPRVLIFRAGLSHHNDVVPKSDRCVIGLTVRPFHCPTVPPEPKRLRKKLQGSAE